MNFIVCKKPKPKQAASGTRVSNAESSLVLGVYLVIQMQLCLQLMIHTGPIVVVLIRKQNINKLKIVSTFFFDEEDK